MLRLAEAGVIASIMTKNMAGTSLRNFVTNENPRDGITFVELLRGSESQAGGFSKPLGAFGPVQGMSAGANWEGIWQNTKAQYLQEYNP